MPKPRITLMAAFATLAALAALAVEPGTVAGTLTVGGKTYTLAHAYARRQPNPAEKNQTVFLLLLSDNEVPKSILDDRFRLELTDLARDGKFHGVSVTVGRDKRITGTGWTYAKELGGAIVNRPEQHTFEPGRFDESRVEGKLSGRGRFGDDTWEYAAEFAAVPER